LGRGSVALPLWATEQLSEFALDSSAESVGLLWSLREVSCANCGFSGEVMFAELPASNCFDDRERSEAILRQERGQNGLECHGRLVGLQVMLSKEVPAIESIGDP